MFNRRCRLTARDSAIATLAVGLEFDVGISGWGLHGLHRFRKAPIVVDSILSQIRLYDDFLETAFSEKEHIDNFLEKSGR